jgi:hypothetical protein
MVLVPQDRYDIGGLLALLREFGLRSGINQESLGELIESVETFDTSSTDQQVDMERAVVVHAQLTNATSGNVGRVLIDIDRELRRTALFLIDRSQRPSKTVGAVELMIASQSNSIELVITASKQMYRLMKLQPLSFVVTFSWFWAHRLNQTKLRSMNEDFERIVDLDGLIVSGAAALSSHQLTFIYISIDNDGFTQIWFSNDTSGFRNVEG